MLLLLLLLLHDHRSNIEDYVNQYVDELHVIL